MKRRPHLPNSAHNLISMVGATIALVTAAMLAVSLGVQLFVHDTNPYVGIVLYMLLPGMLVFGLVLIPFGMWRRKRRVRLGIASTARFILDLNRPTHRNAFIIFVVGTGLFIAISVVGAYQAYHFTESVSFCGTTCHTVMKPEHTAYSNSPHARVACVSCHVGSGAGWYTKSKLSGAYQVYAVTRNIFPRPIPTPVHNLRPAQETCEQCHWPEKFFYAQQKHFDNYMYDDENTPWPVDLLLNTGGGEPGGGRASGIHWHMNISTVVEYIARDERRQDIPWVRMTDRRTGEATVYQNEEDPLSEEEIAAATPRIMDCVDCHNRPSHIYYSPDVLVNRAIAAGAIDASLPEVKRVAVEAMDDATDSDTEDEAVGKVAEAIVAFYEEEYPDVFEERRESIDRAVTAAQDQFKTSVFPEMKVTWRAYPDNIGHLIYPGCMRCHNGNHSSDDGRTITRSCNACHSILSQGSGDRAQWATSLDGLEFVHPEDIDEEWRESACYECHEGVQP